MCVLENCFLFFFFLRRVDALYGAETRFLNLQGKTGFYYTDRREIQRFPRTLLLGVLSCVVLIVFIFSVRIIIVRSVLSIIASCSTPVHRVRTASGWFLSVFNRNQKKNNTNNVTVRCDVNGWSGDGIP